MLYYHQAIQKSRKKSKKAENNTKNADLRPERLTTFPGH